MLPGTVEVEPSVAFMVPAISSTFVWILFAIALAVFVVYTAILFYHWFQYAIKDPYTYPSVLVYLLGSVFLIVIMFFAAIAVI